MAEPYIGQIMIFAGNYEPRGWAFCNGQLMSIAQNTALFSLLGTAYGGDGKATFGLPDLRGRVPMHFGQGAGLSAYSIGQNGGTEQVTLLSDQMPMHTHTFNPTGATVTVQAGDGTGTVTSPSGNYLANAGNPDGISGTVGNNFAPQAGAGTLSNLAGVSLNFGAGAIGVAGGNIPHTNLQPYLALNFLIALVGIFPSRA